MSEKKLPQKLKELRKVNNYTQDYVAAVLGIVRQTYSHYETGRRTPDAEALYKLAGLYNISIDDLMHLTVDIDREVSYDAPVPSKSSEDLSEFLEFFNDPANKKKYMFHTNLEKELLFYFNKISEEDKKEIIEFTKIKARPDILIPFFRGIRNTVHQSFRISFYRSDRRFQIVCNVADQHFIFFLAIDFLFGIVFQPLPHLFKTCAEFPISSLPRS